MASTMLDQIIAIARQAGEAIMAIYEGGDFEVSQKDNNSPLTKADQAAHDIIEAGLKKMSPFPVLSEEGEQNVGTAETFWLVDPLDGTKEFIKKNGEFTVNIALIKNQQPVLGVVYAPAKDVIYAASQDDGAYKIEKNQKVKINAKFKGDIPVVVASRSHRDANIEKFLQGLGEHQAISMGSSLKFCLVAEGKASHYPRFAPTYTWDTAAADAVVRIAGGSVKDLRGKALVYPPKAQLNPFFIVKGSTL